MTEFVVVVLFSEPLLFIGTGLCDVLNMLLTAVLQQHSVVFNYPSKLKVEEWQLSTWLRSGTRWTKASWMAENRLKIQGAPQGGWAGDKVKSPSQQYLVLVYSPALFPHFPSPTLCVQEDSGREHCTPFDLCHGAATLCSKHDHYRLPSVAVRFQTRHSHCIAKKFLMRVDGWLRMCWSVGVSLVTLTLWQSYPFPCLTCPEMCGWAVVGSVWGQHLPVFVSLTPQCVFSLF